jgi:hypothetical protein
MSPPAGGVAGSAGAVCSAGGVMVVGWSVDCCARAGKATHDATVESKKSVLNI